MRQISISSVGPQYIYQNYQFRKNNYMHRQCFCGSERTVKKRDVLWLEFDYLKCCHLKILILTLWWKETSYILSKQWLLFWLIQTF